MRIDPPEALRYKDVTVTSLFFDVNGVRMCVEDFGGEGPPLIMLHSTGFGRWMWRPLGASLVARFHLYAPDQRGHGDTDKPETGYDFVTLAQDIDGLLDALGLGQVFAMGHSAGATTLASHAALFPGRIRRLLMVEPVTPGVQAGRRPANEGGGPNPMVERTLRRRTTFASAQAMFDWFRGRAPFDTWTEESLRLYCEEGTRPVDGGVTLKCPPEYEARFYDTVSRFDATQMLTALRLRVRFLWGESDHGPDGTGPGAEALVRGAETKRIPGTTHFMPMEKPEVVAAEAIDFLREDAEHA